MNNVKSTKRAFLSSVLATILCFAMLLGTTFAWFTDTVESGVNTIIAGNLDIKLTHKNSIDAEEEVTNQTYLFDEVTLWEPGAMAYEQFTISNEGTLDLKYLFTLNANNATEVNGISFAEMLKVAVVDADFKYTREEVASITEWKSLETFSLPGTLNDKESYTFGIVIWWQPSENDNIFNIADKVEVSVGVTLVATQLVSEEDGFDSSYDKGAPWMGGVDTAWYFENPEATEFVIDTAEELAGLAALVNGTATAPVTTFAATAEVETVHDDFKDKTIKLAADIDLYDIPWTPIGRIGQTSTDFTFAFKGTFDGQDHTISNVDVNVHGWAGVFGIAYESAINNLKVENASIRANRMTGTIVGQLYGSIDNCHVENAVILVTPNAVGDSYDNGDKVGGIVGWLGDNGNNRTLTNCSATDVELGAYRDVGGIAGYVASSTTISNNKVDELTITVDQTTNHYGYKDPNANEIFGRTGGEVIEKDNTVGEEIAVNSTVSQNGLTIKIDGVTDETVLYLVPEDYEGATVTVPDGVTAIGNYAFSQNTNVETVVLSSTVRDLGRGFDSSTVKKVVLNEGLEEISSRAFRSTTALEEVVISSTVTEIADNAFQKSSIKKITIPANVETIGETSFGASLIESVVFEGNTEIQGYAFRGCTNLRTVYLLGDDVKFVASTLNCRNSMWFCNGESNNPGTSNITFYVANETVAARVKTAMGAEANNTPVHVVKFIYTVEELTDACANGGEYLLSTDLQLNDTITVSSGVEVTLYMNGKTIASTLSGTGNQDLFMVKGTMTVKNGTIELTATQNQGWGSMSTIFDITEGGVVTLDTVAAENKGGTDMNFVAHLNNWGTATLNVTDSTLKATYVAVRVFNSGYDMNNVTIKNSTLSTEGKAAFWVHNYTAADFGTQEKADEQAKLLNFNLVGNTYIANKAAFRYGMTNAIYKNADGNQIVSSTTELINAIKNAPVGKETVILMADGNYDGDIAITEEAFGKSGGDVVIKAMGENAVITGTVTLGYRNQGVGAAVYNANVTFDGVIFDHAESGKHSLYIQDVKSLTLINCTIIGDGEYGIDSARGNATGTSKITNCTFVNAGMQLLGNFATGLVIDGCTFNESRINVQAGNGVTVQNCKFNNTLTAANVGDSFYAIRSNSTPITVKNCEMNIDSELTEVATAQAKWYLLANRGTTNWTVENVAVTLTDAALAQTELDITACTSTGVINTTNLTVNGVAQ